MTDKGDLISREALKKAIEEQRKPKVYSEADERQNIIVDCILYIIDNAPTVEAIPTELHEKILDKVEGDLFKVQEELNRMRNEKRQGEWLRKEDVIHHIAKQYSEHNEIVPIWLSIADMRGEAVGELLECQSHLRPQGEWIIDQNEKFYHYKCPFCGFWATGDFLSTNDNLDLPNFCEKCGADMRGEEE